MDARCCYAHTVDGRPKEDWQELADHLTATADLAAGFAEAFNSGEWGRLAGLWHDLGKYDPEFQKRLAGERVSVDHAVVGALEAMSKDKASGLGLAMALAGHHTGLANLQSADTTPPTPFKERIAKNAAALREVLPQVPAPLVAAALPPLPPRFLAKGLSHQAQADLRRSLGFWTRFLFSALVDADSLDTEAFEKPGLRERVLAGRDPLPVLRQRLDAHVDEKTRNASSSAVNRLRADVLGWCREAAAQPPGVFSLTVPTGGGKTLASMSFALRHAERHGLARVIAVIPYTSIIEQNAAVYRDALGDGNVVEHHSNLDPKEREQETEIDKANRLGSENWDAPVIVTTGVQFFESLFANRRSRCRKLHNVARSVLLLDEAQTLPARFLSPILEGLRELVSHYGCTVVLSTATQPALARREGFPDGLPDVREIVPDPAALGRDLRRVEVRWPDLDAPAVAWPDLAAELAGLGQVLAIVHRRQDARELAQLLPAEGRFHLSALMCPKHRTAVLAEVKEALKAGRVCRLVSTQLIEAGVDIDFPVVYRALAGIDSVVQAAGRCNREGGPDLGRVIVFRAPTRPPAGTAAKGLETTEALLRQYGVTLDPKAPSLFEAYFRSLYFKEDLDAEGIQRERAELNFATVARRFQLIEDGYSHPIVVPYGDAERRVDKVRHDGPRRENLRALQPFLVNVYDRDLARLEDAGALETVADTVRVLVRAFAHLYSPAYGLVIEEPLQPSPESGVV